MYPLVATAYNHDWHRDTELATLSLTQGSCIEELGDRSPGVVDGEKRSCESPGGIRYSVRWCAECRVWADPNTTHCVACEVCVSHWDHHCPWAGTCIGAGLWHPPPSLLPLSCTYTGNLRFFMGFTFMCGAGCLLGSIAGRALHAVQEYCNACYS